MSTVLPPAAALLLEAPLLALLLLLLLQPTAAKATAAKAAIAVVRLMIFLSSFEVVRLPRSEWTGPVWVVAVRQPEMAGWTSSLTAAGPPREPIAARISGRADVAAGTSASDFPTLAQSRPVCRRSAELRLDRSACTRRSPSPGFDRHGHRPRPFDVSHWPDRTHKRGRQGPTAVFRQQVCSDQAVLARRACQIRVSRSLSAGNEPINSTPVRDGQRSPDGQAVAARAIPRPGKCHHGPFGRKGLKGLLRRHPAGRASWPGGRWPSRIRG
jgi:hypothetical protein